MGSSRLAVVYLVDVSHSVSSRAIAEAATKIDALNSDVKPSHWRILAFGADATVLETTAALRDLGALDPASPKSPVRRDTSDLERALRQARAELVPGHVPSFVLFSDGRPTAGDVSEAIASLVAEGIPVSVVPLPPRDVGDAWVDAVRWPQRLTAGALTPVVVSVGSQRAGNALVELRAGGRVLASKAAALTVGLTSVAMDVTFDGPGPQAVEAVLSMPGDPLAANNRLGLEALVRERPRVLYVEGAAGSTKYLQGALQGSGFDVAVRPPAGLPSTPADLDPWDVLILSDVSRTAMSDKAMAAIGQWVEQGGGGLLVAGGDAVYGEGSKDGPPGYRNTEIERLTPVTFERKDEPEVALIIVLDKSWSMAGSVMELCKAAAQAAIDALQDEHSVGVVTFNDGLNWDVTLRNVGKNRDAIRKAVSAIEPSGHTLIFPAVEQAYLALRDARARAKHVVLLSDGRSYPDDYEGLVTKMVGAKMTVSAIAVGPAADVELLTNIAKWGKGRSYVVADAKEVPQIFVKEAKEATTPAFDEKSLKPVVKVKGFLEGVDLTKAPALRGRTAVVTKDSALEMLSTEDGDPLLAFWPIGLGRSAVFASDVKDRWASDWLKWRGYGPFFAAVVHAIERQRPQPVALDVQPGPIRDGSRTVSVVVESRDARGQYRDSLRPVVSARAGDGRSAQLPARQVGPGRYEARIVTDAAQPLTVSVAGPDGTQATRLVVPDPAAEYRFRAPDLDLLGAVAQGTGGAVAPDGAALRRSAQSARAARRALWPALVGLALALWLADVLLRRVRVFESESADAVAATPVPGTGRV
jgi:uncharacterized membrane protein/uncharacterized protein YegL